MVKHSPKTLASEEKANIIVDGYTSHCVMLVIQVTETDSRTKEAACQTNKKIQKKSSL